MAYQSPSSRFSKTSFASLRKLATIRIITAPIGKAAMMLTDCRLCLTIVCKELHGHLSPSFGGCAANFQIIRSRGKTANKA